MNVLETVGLRTSAGNSKDVEAFLREWLESTRIESRVMKSYRQVNLETDFSVHIQYESNEEKPVPSVTGKQLAETFKEFGLVNHTVWIEQNI